MLITRVSHLDLECREGCSLHGTSEQETPPSFYSYYVVMRHPGLG